MADNLIKQITHIVTEKTVSQRIPTVVFLSDIDKGSLIKHIIWSIKGGNQEEDKFLSDDWQKVAEIMQALAEIPLLLKETSDSSEIKTETENFIKEMNKSKGIVIINSKLSLPPFTNKENISIIRVNG